MAPVPPIREGISPTELRIRDRLRRREIARMAEDAHDAYGWPDMPVKWQYFQRSGVRGFWTTQRMFDGRFWSYKLVWRPSIKKWTLLKTSVRQHAKRMNAKARAKEMVHGD